MSSHLSIKRAASLVLTGVLAWSLAGSTLAASIDKRASDKAQKHADKMVKLIVTYKRDPDAADVDHIARLKGKANGNGYGKVRRKLKGIKGHAVSVPADELDELVTGKRVAMHKLQSSKATL